MYTKKKWGDTMLIGQAKQLNRMRWQSRIDAVS